MQNKKRFISVSATFLSIVILSFAVTVLAFGSDKPGSAFTNDSGVAVCQKMASSSTPADLDEDWRQERLTEFGLSKHEDLRKAGTEFVEAAFRMNEELEDADLEKLNELNSNLVTKHAVLRNACKNHGVNVPALNA